jgi:hypothetical protein
MLPCFLKSSWMPFRILSSIWSKLAPGADRGEGSYGVALITGKMLVKARRPKPRLKA